MILLNDLGLRVSLWIAEFMVWRVVCRRQRAKAIRRRNLKLVHAVGGRIEKGEMLVAARPAERSLLRDAWSGNEGRKEQFPERRRLQNY